MSINEMLSLFYSAGSYNGGDQVQSEYALSDVLERIYENQLTLRRP